MSGSRTSFLIAEDFREMARIVRSLLNGLGFSDIDEAPNGSAALEKLRKRRYDVLIADVNMEPVNGIELLSEIRGDGELAPQHIIMVTGSAEEERVLQAKQIGVDAYILKPFSITAFKRTVVRVLKASGAAPGARSGHPCPSASAT